MVEETDSKAHFFGAHVFSLDAQGRVAVPAEWREGNRSFRVIPGKNATLQLYPLSTFEERIMSKLKKLSPANPDDLQKLRWLCSRIDSCECDKQGRIQISANLLGHAKLGKRIALVGSGDFAQIMTAERWEQELKPREAENSDSFLDILG